MCNISAETAMAAGPSVESLYPIGSRDSWKQCCLNLLRLGSFAAFQRS